ncbi:MAG: RdgB/HAM1 family non-canonical purine NTP pyrophosphatase [Coxiellaceae bacterium]|nr:MAG: RdgB/HAM1 family non-canonical purine NTP pyrophosphatase [Coxiellaceae bacterium]
MQLTHPIVLASANAGKLAEIQQYFADIPVKLCLQTDFQILSAPETAATFVENALQKARHVSRLTGLPAIADDSGLIVDALQGAPGLYSARYAGPNATDHDNIHKLLLELANVPPPHRTARFYSVMVYLASAEDPMPIIAQGVWEGSILLQPQGAGGFGYDPIFYVPEQQCSAAELSIEHKNQLSHRGQALQQLKAQLWFLLKPQA